MKDKIITRIISLALVVFAFSGWFLYTQELEKNDILTQYLNNALDTEEINDARQFADSIMYYKTYYDLVNRHYGIKLMVEKTDSVTTYTLDTSASHELK